MVKNATPFQESTEREVNQTLYTIDPATGTEYAVAQAVPHAATPFWTQIAPDHVPTTSELKAGRLTFSYAVATNILTVYMNEGGAIVSLAIGVMV